MILKSKNEEYTSETKLYDEEELKMLYEAPIKRRFTFTELVKRFRNLKDQVREDK